MKPRVLVVDDEAHIVHVMAAKLQRAGIDVLTAMDGQEALQVAAEQPVDLVITDYRMPLMNGVELCRRLAQMDNTRDAPVILLTAHGHYIPEPVTSAMKIREVFAKPFSPREILAKVNDLLGRSQPNA